MSKSEARPNFSSDNTFGVHGDRIDIGLSTLDEFAARLGQVGETPLKLIDSEELSTELPPPIEKVVFEARAPQAGDTMPILSASVDLSIDTIRDFRSEKGQESWSTPYLLLLISYLRTSGFTVDYVPHDLDTIHARLDKNYATSIKIVGDLQSCVVRLSLETIDDLENAIGEMSEIPPDEPSNPVIVAQYFATALGATIDAALETFDAPGTGRHLLELTRPASKKAQAKLAKKAAALAALEQPKFPEAEQIHQVRGLARLPGLFAAKRRLQEIAEDYGDSEAAKMYEINPTHFLLYGPPGTGKSTLVEALAEEIGPRTYQFLPVVFTAKMSAVPQKIFKQCLMMHSRRTSLKYYSLTNLKRSEERTIVQLIIWRHVNYYSNLSSRLAKNIPRLSSPLQ